MDAEDSSEDDFKIEDVLDRVGDVHDCPHCGEVFSTLSEVEKHISIEHGKLFFDLMAKVLKELGGGPNVWVILKYSCQKSRGFQEIVIIIGYICDIWTTKILF